MAYSGATKILKQGGEQLDQFEQSVSQVSTREWWTVSAYVCDEFPYVGTDWMSVWMCVQALLDVESNADIRASLREVYFTGAKEIDAAGKKAICIQVPVPQQKTFQKIQVL